MSPVSKCVRKLQKNISIAHQILQNIENAESIESDSDISDNEVLEENAFIDEEKAEAVSNVTRRRKRAKSRQAATGTINITNFFSKDEKFDLKSSDDDNQDVDCIDDDNQDIDCIDTENNQQQSIENNQQHCIDTNQQKSIDNTIMKIEMMIKNEKPRKVELVHFQLVIWYLHLLQNGKNKTESSETVTTVCNKGKYYTRYIRR
ncbi:19638_t:CDS:2 [Racocetra fulgida]|uniref:19638_t:CDS:1 n=1 Tax=Racocetra fulgida TaxID=60492 RepID=A0A9N8ZSD2_9GLOM|nr:19638_t:CDS:2 [Racocetra fulgida]